MIMKNGNKKSDVKQEKLHRKQAFNEMDEYKTEEVVLTPAVQTRTVMAPPCQKSLCQKLQLPFIGLLLLYGLFFKS